MSLERSLSLPLRALALFALLATATALPAGCSSDDGSSEEAEPEPEPSEFADVEITQTECDYDDQCDEKLAELEGTCQKPKCVDGACMAVQRGQGIACDDSSVGDCEQGICNDEGVCIVAAAANGTLCQTDAWTSCIGFECMGAVCTAIDTTTCDDDNECTIDTCDPDTGCVFTSDDGASCDDGNLCTEGDQCSDGDCAGELTCNCGNDSDCAPFEDGDLCNGTLHCVLEHCVLDEDTIVSCGGDGDGNACTANACDPGTGECVSGPVEDGTLCDDDELCTGCLEGDEACEDADADQCLAGTCTGGAAEPCACTEDADCTQFDDGDLCNGLWTCMEGTCGWDEATIVDCGPEDAIACQSTACEADSGECVSTNLADDTSCDDGEACNGADSCLEGACEAGSEDLCTCTEDVDCEAVDDGDLCTGVWVCDVDTCVLDVDSVVDCSETEHTACEEVTCNAETGSCDVSALEDGAGCDDEDPCTSEDACAEGTCAGADSGDCACTLDEDCAAFDDGDLCNGTWTCQEGTCAWAEETVVDCSGEDAAICMVSMCNPDSGACEEVADTDANGTECEVDGDLCTTGGACMLGACMGEADETVDCSGEEVEACQVSTCNPDTGACESGADADADGASCEADDDLCTTGGACDAGSCIGEESSTVDCSGDDGPCATGACNPADGTCSAEQHDADSPCTTDDDACTTEGTCSAAGVCEGEDPVDCTSDDGPCTVGVCNAESGGCDAASKDDDTPCETDESLCTDEGACQQGVCEGEGPKDCSDEDGTCVIGKCNPGNGECQAAADTSQNGDPCTTDDDLCTTEGSCDAGSCGGEAAKDCSVHDGECVIGQCNEGSGACEAAPDAGQNSQVCDDGDPCTDQTTCAEGACGDGVPTDPLPAECE